MIPRSTDGKIRILSLSYGKDSMACLGAIEQLGWPLDGIVTAEVWATQDIPADLPPMVEFKAKADAIIKERWGFEVNHCCAMRGGEKLTYEDIFYRPIKNPKVRRGAGRHLRIRNKEMPVVQQPTQGIGPSRSKTEYMDSRTRRLGDGVTGSKTRLYGFPISVGGGGTGVRPSRQTDYGMGNESKPVLHGRTQTSRNYGFPQIKGNWCNSYLKQPVFK